MNHTLRDFGTFLRLDLRKNYSIYISRFSRWVLLLLLIITGALVNEHFLTYFNVANIARQASLLAMISFGMTLAMVARGLDLSVGSVVALATVIAAPILHEGNLAAGVVVAASIGVLVGFINGLMVAYLGMPSFIATYGTLRIARGLALLYSGGLSIYGFDQLFRRIGSGFIARVPTPVFVALFMFAGLYFATRYTTWGRKVYAVGANPVAAKYSGFDIRKILFSVYSLSGLLSGLAGLVYVAYVNAAEPVIGDLFALDAIAVALVGGTSFVGGIGGVGATIIGSLIIAVLNTIMNLVNMSSYWQVFAKGAVIVLALVLDQALRRIGAPRVD